MGKAKKKVRYAGVHLIAEFWGGEIIEDKKEISKMLYGAASHANSTPLELSIHKFNPKGATGVLLLAESHIAVHTWPELNYIAVDIFTCGSKAMPHKALEFMKKRIRPKKIVSKEIKRGKYYAEK